MHTAFLLAKNRQHITLLTNKLFTTKRYTFSIALSNVKYITYADGNNYLHIRLAVYEQAIQVDNARVCCDEIQKASFKFCLR